MTDRKRVQAPPLAPSESDLRFPEMMWGRKLIASFLGVGERQISAWARRPDCPIYMPSGRYLARRSELERWTRTKPVRSSNSDPKRTKAHEGVKERS